MSASTLVLTGLVFACLGVVLGVSGWIVAVMMNVPKRGEFDLKAGGFSTKVAYAGIVGGGFALGVAVIALIASGLWWGFALLLTDATPGKLALICITVGPAPLLITAFASGIAALLRCSIDAGGARNCILLGLDLGPFLHSLFMAYWLVFVTGGLAFIGLMVSGVWALVRLF